MSIRTKSVSGAAYVSVAPLRAAPLSVASFTRPPSIAGLYIAPDLVVILTSTGRSRRSTYDVLSHCCHQIMSRRRLDTRRPTLTFYSNIIKVMYREREKEHHEMLVTSSTLTRLSDRDQTNRFYRTEKTCPT